ncbi:MAG TPA: PQQ-dependent sugar dehydrogenase [Myxococcota bacterium]|nr:PQQ-dependent sugar dehydrogenase [Myxococcota bacterium]
MHAPTLRGRKTVWSLVVLAPWLAFSAHAALPSAPTSPSCLSHVGVGSFAGHAFPLDSVPDPGAMSLVEAFPGLTFSAPIYAAVPPDGSGRLFVVERAGRILVVQNGAVLATPFLDIRSLVETSGEHGLLSVAFPPDFASSGLFYVYYSANSTSDPRADGSLTLARLRVGANPNVADASSLQTLLSLPKPLDGPGCASGSPQTNHNGGTILFGPDGYLYLGIGDGGGAGDACNLAQNGLSAFGKMLRLDVSGGYGTPFTIPPGNPFAGSRDPSNTVLDVIWAIGLRNPFRFSFDRATGDLWIGDVGQDAKEEFDFEPVASGGGRNYGWHRMEGFDCYDPSSNCNDGSLTLPVLDYGHSEGHSITGGVVYRGDRFPSLFGAYLFADYTLGPVWAYPSSAPGAQKIRLATLAGITAIVEDAAHEPLFVDILDGKLYRLQASTGGTGQFPTLLSQTGLFSNTGLLTPKPGLVEYRVKAPLWSDGADKRRWIGLPAGQQIGFSPTGAWTFPVGTVFVKHFELRLAGGGRTRLETRVLLRQTDRYVAYTYRWNAQQTDATLVTAAQTASYSVDGSQGPVSQTWTFPGPGDCLACHTAVEGRVLGVRTPQIDLDWSCENETENQLAAWASAGMFSGSVGSPQSFPRYVDPSDASAPIGLRARSYLATNCEICHQPNGTTPVDVDFRFATPLAAMNVVNVPPTAGTLGLVSPMRLLPGVKERSVLWHRMQITGASRMPQGSSVPDPTAVAVVGAWIDQDPTRDTDGDGVPDDVDNCPAVANTAQGDVDGDGRGDFCDDCTLIPNPDQASTDGDPIGDVCDDLCVGTRTTLTSVTPARAAVGSTVELVGTGFASNAEVWFGEAKTPLLQSGGHFTAKVPPIYAGRSHPVTVVNPQGCRSQEARSVVVDPPPGSCGLLGVEGLLVVAGVRAVSRRRPRRG